MQRSFYSDGPPQLLLDAACVPTRAIRLGGVWRDCAHVYRSPSRRHLLFQGPHDIALVDLSSIGNSGSEEGGERTDPLFVCALPPQPHRELTSAALLLSPNSYRHGERNDDINSSGCEGAVVASGDTRGVVTVARLHSNLSNTAVTTFVLDHLWETKHSHHAVDTIVPCGSDGRFFLIHRTGERTNTTTNVTGTGTDPMVWMCAVESTSAWPVSLSSPACATASDYSDTQGVRLFDICSPLTSTNAAAAAAADVAANYITSVGDELTGRLFAAARPTCVTVHQTATVALVGALPFPHELAMKGYRASDCCALGGGTGQQYVMALTRGTPSLDSRDRTAVWVGCYDGRKMTAPYACCAWAPFINDCRNPSSNISSGRVVGSGTAGSDRNPPVLLEALGPRDAAVCAVVPGSGELLTMRRGGGGAAAAAAGGMECVSSHMLAPLGAPDEWQSDARALAFYNGTLHVLSGSQV